MEIKKSFTGGKMNKSLDDRLMPEGIYRHAENVKVSVTDDDDSGVVQNYLGNTEKLDVNALLIDEGFVSQGDTMIPIGSYTDTRRNDIYWFITARDYDIIAVYHENNDGTSNGKLLLVETRGDQAMMNFNESYLISGVNIIDNLLFFTDGLNSPKRLLISNTYRDSKISSDTVNVIVKPPLSSPEVRLVKDIDVKENTIEDKFIRFAYRYKYRNNEISAIGPFSKTAFEAQKFKFDFNTGRNESMRNNANRIVLTLETGGPDVIGIDVISRDTDNQNITLVGSVDLDEDKDPTVEFEFKNTKTHRVIPEDQVSRLFDNVPLSAKAQDIIGRRVVYGNYKQFYDIKDAKGNDIVPNMSLSFKSKSLNSDDYPVETFKSGRDYEAGIVYLDEFGRMTTVIDSESNNVTIPISEARSKNDLVLTINHEAPNQEEYKLKSPFFASSYRIFLKQNRRDYYNIIPISTHRDGLFVYLQLAQYDVNKVKAGEYIYVKNTLKGNTLEKKYKVLELETKEKNFIGEGNGSWQDSGVYIKIKVDDYLLSSQFELIQYSSVANSNSGLDFSTNGRRSPLLEYVVGRYSPDYKNHVDFNIPHYGEGSLGAKAIPFNSDYNFGRDKRLYIEITSTDTFRYREYNSAAWIEEDVLINGYNIPGFGQGGNRLSTIFGGKRYVYAYILWDEDEGYNVGDTYRVNCRGDEANISGNPIDFEDKKGGREAGFCIFPKEKQNIRSGSVITLQIKDETDQPTQRFISSSNYDSIEEWFYEDLVVDKFKHKNQSDKDIGFQNVFFRRGIPVDITAGVDDTRGTMAYVGEEYGYSVPSQNTGYRETHICMLIRSTMIPPSDANTRVMKVVFKIQTPENICILETEGEKATEEIYYELPTTYPIVGTRHWGSGLLGDVDQEPGRAAQIVLRDFNAITFGNGIESYIIEDDWNGTKLLPSPRASTSIDRYEQIDSVNSLTYSEVYNNSTSTNNLNEFNYAKANFKILEEEYGSVQKLYARDRDLIVFQEDKVSKVLFERNLLSDSIGGGNIVSIPEVLGTQLPYNAEFGISKNPESFAKWGNDIFFTDESRGAVLNLTQTGIQQISTYGMRSYFRDLFDSTAGKQKLGAFDPHEFKYVLSWNEKEVADCEFSVTPEEIFVTGDEISDGFLFAIKSNSDWSIEVIQTGSWLVLSRMDGNGDAVITGSLQSNLSGPGTREATIQVTYCGGQVKNIPLIQSNNKKKVVDVVTTGDTNNDGGKSVQPSYDSPSGGYQGGQAPLGDGGKYYTYDPLEDYVGLGNVPNTGDTVDIIGDTAYQDASGDPLKPFNPDLGNKMYYLDTDTKYTSDQGDEIVSNGTPVSPVLSGGVYKGSFTYNGTGKYLYMLVDHTNIINMGTSVSSIPTAGYELPESINLNNADDIGRYSVSYSHNSTNIRFTIENSNGGVVADSGVLTSPSSGSFDVSKTILGGDVIKVYGPNSGELYNLNVGVVSLDSFTISSQGYETVDEACSSVNTQIKYHNGASANPVIGSTIYDDANGLSVFNGEGLFYKVGTDSLSISTEGVVISIQTCICSETSAPVVDATELTAQENQEFRYSIQATNNPTLFSVSGNCREYEFFGGLQGAVFSGVDCTTGLTKEFSVSANQVISRCFFIGTVTKVGGSDDASFSDVGGCIQESLPSGLSFIRDSGTIFGTPTEPGFFQLTVNATNCFGTSSDEVIKINVKSEREPNPEFLIDLTNPQTSSSSACSISTPNYTTMYHNGIMAYPVIYDMVFQDPNGFNLYNGNNQWFLMDNGVAVLIDSDGIVNDTLLCNFNPPMSKDPVSLAVGPSALDSCSSSSFSTYYYDGTIGVNPGNLYADEFGIGLAPAGWYKYEVSPGVFISLQWDGLDWVGSFDCP